MRRRTAIATAGTSGIALLSGCLGELPIDGSTVEAEFELVEADLDADDPPAVSVDDGTVTARGTVEYGSSECGTVELAHAAYERSQDRLDLLVVAADDTNDSSGTVACTDDIVRTGYRLEATVDDRLRRVTVTEHHAFGEAYSTTAGGPRGFDG